MHISLLGPVTVTHDGVEIRLNGHHQRALVAMLASEPGKVMPAGRLIDALWGDRPPATARTKLQGCVSGLRKQLTFSKPPGIEGQWPLRTRDPGYLLCADKVTVDLSDYRTLLRCAAGDMDDGRFTSASTRLGAALALWCGPAYADARTRVISAMASALEVGRQFAILRKAECDLMIGRYDAVNEELGLALATHPLHEGMRATLMLALYRANCRAEALEAYRVGHALLREQLGIEPGPVLRRLHELILRADPRLAASGALAELREAPGVAG